MLDSRAWPRCGHIMRLGFFSIIAVLILLPLVLEGLHALDWKLRCRIGRRQAGELSRMMVMWMNELRHGSMVGIPTVCLLFAIGKESVVEFGRRHF